LEPRLVSPSRARREADRMKRPIVIVAMVIAALSLAGTAYANDLKFTAELTGAQDGPPRFRRRVKARPSSSRTGPASPWN
jgi:hypothetical protein